MNYELWIMNGEWAMVNGEFEDLKMKRYADMPMCEWGMEIMNYE